MPTHCTSDFFSHNRARLRAVVNSQIPIVITGNGAMQRAGDEQAAFHQDSSFWYLTGLDSPDLTLVMLATETYLIVPSMSLSRQAFDGAHDKDAYLQRSGIDEALDEQEGWRRLRQALHQRQVATVLPLPSYSKTYGLHALPFRRRLIAKLKKMDSKVTIQDVRADLAGMRAVKQSCELAAIQSAIDITTATLTDVTAPAALATIQHEYQLEAGLTYGFRRRGADGHGFSPIVGAGHHSTTLHHVKNNGPVADTDLIVLDVGAQCEHYCADITRTVSKKPITGRAAELFNAVAEAQEYALGLMKPGVLSAEYEQAVEAFIGTKLVELGLITTPTRATIRRYFPHATSHFLGLDVHDVGDYRSSWQPQMVLTCEPGIYIPEEGIGVRIEDDVLITPSGNRVLSAACPRALTFVQ